MPSSVTEVFLCGLRNLKLSYNRRFSRIIESYGVTQTMLDVLLFLNNNPSHDTAQAICNLRGIAKSNASRAVDDLVKRGYLGRGADADNRRVVHLRILPPAQPLVAEAARLQQAHLEQLLDGVAPEDWTAAIRVMERVADNAANLHG